jgi:hypothetical protein
MLKNKMPYVFDYIFYTILQEVELGGTWRRGEVFTGFWLGSQKVRDHWEELGVGERITLSWTLGR